MYVHPGGGTVVRHNDGGKMVTGGWQYEISVIKIVPDSHQWHMIVDESYHMDGSSILWEDTAWCFPWHQDVTCLKLCIVYFWCIFITLLYLFGQRYSSVVALAGENVDHTYHSESIFLATITIYWTLYPNTYLACLCSNHPVDYSMLKVCKENMMYTCNSAITRTMCNNLDRLQRMNGPCRLVFPELRQ